MAGVRLQGWPRRPLGWQCRRSPQEMFDIGRGDTRQTINAIEQEKYSPSLEPAFRVAEVFQVGFEYVFRFPGRDK